MKLRTRIFAPIVAVLIAASIFAVPASAQTSPIRIANQVLTGASSGVTFSSIADASRYSLHGIVRSRSTSTSCGTTPHIVMQLGASASLDTNNNYSGVRVWDNGTSGFGHGRDTTTSKLYLGWSASACASYDSSAWGVVEFWIPGGLDDAGNKQVISRGTLQQIATSTTGTYWQDMAGEWTGGSGGKITDMRFELSDGTNFAIGSLFTLYAE